MNNQSKGFFFLFGAQKLLNLENIVLLGFFYCQLFENVAKQYKFVLTTF